MSKRGAYTKLWIVVKEIIRRHYPALKKERMRDSYYMVRDFLGGKLGEKHIGVDITQADFDWFLTTQGYSSYRDDIWTAMEQKENLKSPRRVPEGIIIQDGEVLTMAKWEEKGIKFVWSRARGFIFSEKRGPALKLKPLSKFGWTIVTVGRGFPTRLIRQLLKKDKRPILALHDCDVAGGGIYRALGFKTRRTAHLDIELGDRVIDLGLSDEDVQILDLPSQPEAPKYRKIREERWELTALTVLKLRMGVKEPVLEYTIAKMNAKGIMISQLEISKRNLWEVAIRMKIKDAISKVVDQLVKEESEDYTLNGKAVDIIVSDIEMYVPDLWGLVSQAVEDVAGGVAWIYEKDRHQQALEKVSPKLVDALDIEREE